MSSIIAGAQGVFVTAHRGVVETHDNLVVEEGRNYIVGAALVNETRHSFFYIAIFGADVSPVSSWTAANFPADANEITNYVSGTRPVWNPTSPASGEVDSYQNKVSFESEADGILVRGAALLSSDVKGGTGGVLIGATRFTNAKPLDTGEALDVGYLFRLTGA